MKLRFIHTILIFIFISLFLLSGCMSYYEDRAYVDPFTCKWGDLEIKISFNCNEQSSLNWITLSNKTVCKEPYKLLLDVVGIDTPYTHLIVNFVEIKYDDGEHIIIKKNDNRPLKLSFKDYAYWENGKAVEERTTKQVFHYFEKTINKEHREGQGCIVNVSLTLMPGEKTKILSGSFHGVIEKHKSNFFEMLEGV